MTTNFTEDTHSLPRDLEDARVVKHIVSIDGIGHRRDVTLYEIACRTCGLSSHRYVENPPT